MPNFQFQRAIPGYARAAFGGKKRMRKRFASRAAGEIWIEKIESRLKALRAGGDLASVGFQKSETFRRIAAGWLDQLVVEPSTEAWYRLYLKKRLLPAFGEMKLTSLGKAELTAYRMQRGREKTRSGRRVGARTIEAEIAVCTRVLRWARSAGYAINESAFEVEPPKVKPAKTRRYDPELVRRLLDAARRGPEPSKKKRGRKAPAALASVAAVDVAVVETICRTGLRVGELRAFSVDWIRWDECRIVVPHDSEYSPKGGRQRSIPLESELEAVLRRHLDGREDGRVFLPATPGRPRGDGSYLGKGLDVQKLMKRLSAAAGLDLTAHDLRHYAISRWVALMPAGRYSLADIQEWAGHESIRTTELYTHTTEARWRSHAAALDRAKLDSELDSPSSQGTLRVLRG